MKKAGFMLVIAITTVGSGLCTIALADPNVPSGYTIEAYVTGLQNVNAIAISPGGVFGFEGQLFVGDSRPDPGSIYRVPSKGNMIHFTSTASNEPRSMEFAPVGSAFGSYLYVSEAYNLRRYDSSGTGTTFAGIHAFGWDLAFAPDSRFRNNLFHADGYEPAGEAVREWHADGTNTPLITPLPEETAGLAFGPGGDFGNDLYVAFCNSRGSTPAIRKVTPDGVMTDFVVSPQFAQTNQLAFDTTGSFRENLFVSDFEHDVIFEIDPIGNVSVFATGFSFSSTPYHETDTGDLVFGPDGALFVADGGAGTVWRIAREQGQTYHVDGTNGSDSWNGLTPESAFETIQKGIDTAEDGATVLVWPGVYVERIYFYGKAITLKSADYPAVIEAPWQDAVSFIVGEGPGSVLSNFVIRQTMTAIACNNESSPTLKNLTIVNNDFGIAAYENSDPDITNCIFWNNRDGDLFGCEPRYSCVETASAGDGNISIDPMFADFGGGDYHLLSDLGRYVPAYALWAFDDVTSLCVDGGDPLDNPSGERMPNGGRINMGAYGGTAYASMSEWPFAYDGNRDGRMDFKDLAGLCNQWLLELPWVATQHDTTPPAGLMWIIEPKAVSWETIVMIAYAEDASGVEYLFRNTTLAYDSGWQDEPNWVDTGLDPNTVYCYALEARDKSPAQNFVALSGEACARTLVSPDTTPPDPAPTWDPNDPNLWPAEIYIGPSPWTGWGYEMTCTVAADPSGPVQYWFQCHEEPSINSGWIAVNTWTTPAFTMQNQNHGFRVKARDGYGNETAWSEVKRPSDFPIDPNLP